MYTISELRDMIKRELDKQEYVVEPRSLFEPIIYMLEDGGKRLRPILTLVAYNLYRDDVERVLKSALGIEIFHNYTLLHDDVMDDAELRRGRLTVHRKWNTNVAILSGDAAAITAYRCIESCEDRYLRQAIDFFNQVAMDVCRGQQYDMEFESRDDVTEEEYVEMIYLKTGVLLAGSLRHGALLGGAPREDYEALYDFGGALGVAFQLQDDCLDVYGEEAEFGKSIGGDIVANKKTYLMIKALELADEKTRAELRGWMERKTFDREEKVAAVRGIYDRLGVKETTERLIDEYLERSREILDRVGVAEERKADFREVLETMNQRKK